MEIALPHLKRIWKKNQKQTHTEAHKRRKNKHICNRVNFSSAFRPLVKESDRS